MLLLYRSVSQTSHRESIFSLVRSVAGYIAIRYPSVGLNNSCIVASVLDPHFHPRQPSLRKHRVRPHRLGWSGQPDIGDFEYDYRPGFEGAGYALLAVLQGQYIEWS